MQTITIIELPVAEEEQPTTRELTYVEWLQKTIEEIEARVECNKKDVKWAEDQVVYAQENLKRYKKMVEATEEHLADFRRHLDEARANNK